MAGLNVAEWTPEQVAEWLSGLGPAVAQYVPALRARGLHGGKLLTLRCDDLEYLGVHVIGHQELLLEAVEHLRNFQYELSRECIQQLALRVSVVATTLARALRHHTDARLETQTLADVARTVHAVKPLVCWLDRWSGAGGWVMARRAELLQLWLEAATCAQRDRFADQPARAVAAAAATTAAAATYIVQEVADPCVLAPAALAAVALRQRGKALGFDVLPSFCGHHQLANIRFGSPAHASGVVHAGDEIVQVNGQCVIGWSGAAVERACTAGGAAGELALRLRRRGARPPPAPPRRLPRHALYSERDVDRAPSAPASSSDESEPLSPPASPTHAHLDHTRMYPEKARAAVQRRHSVSGGSPAPRRPALSIDQFWQQLKARLGGAAGSARASPAPDDVALYARDKAVSYSTGLELAPRPRTCGGGSPPAPPAAPAPPADEEARRGRLDKAHSTPAYDLVAAPVAALVAQTIPESPTTPLDSPTVLVHSAEKADQILEFKKSSSAIGEAMQRRPHVDPPPPAPPARCDPPAPSPAGHDEATTERILETINIAMLDHRRRSLLEQRAARAPAPAPAPDVAAAAAAAAAHDDKAPAPAPRYSYLRSSSRRGSPPPAVAGGAGDAAVAVAAVAGVAVLRCVPRPAAPEPPSPMKPTRHIDASQISVPLRHITKHDIRMIPAEPRHDLPAINAEPAPPALAPAPGAPAPGTPAPAPADIVLGALADRGAMSPTSAVRGGLFLTSKSRSLKKKSSILAKRRLVACRAVAGRGAGGGVWQRVRARSHAAQPRWVRRHLLLTHNLLYAYKSPECLRADCMMYLEGCTVSAAGEVKSRAHAFKVYHTGSAFYFAADSRDAMLAWIQLIHRATLLPSLLSHVDVAKQFSETDYSETESDTESPEKRSDKDRERDKDRDKDKDKSKFGSLKKLTVRMQRSESQENVSHSSTSLDRKYLRFFSRYKSKDDTKPKSKQSVVAVPTDHYRSYRRVAPPAPAPGAGSPPEAPGSPPRAKKIPKPINYIHASNPNLLDFEKSDFVTKPTPQVPAKPKATKPESLAGLVTLEQFMLKKQEEERRQLYSNRVLLGIERDRKQLQQRLHRIVPDVIYGEVGAACAPADIPVPVLELQAAANATSNASCNATTNATASATANVLNTAAYKERRPEPGKGKPISVKGKDGYEKIIYTDDPPDTSEDGDLSCYEGGYGVGSGYGVAGGQAAPRRAAPPPLAPERWRDSLRRNDKVHSARGTPGKAADDGQQHTWNHSGSEAAAGGAGGAGVSRLRLMFGARHTPAQAPRGHYPHLQCPPTFQPETYSLASHPRRARPQPPPRPPEP